MKLLATLLGSLSCAIAISQVPEPAADVYTTSACVGCHGVEAMGGLGPPIAQSKLPYADFLKTVRDGKGMMPATAATVMPDADVARLHEQIMAMPWRPEQIPLSYAVGRMLTTRNLALFFLAVFGFALIFGIKVLVYWLDCAGWKALKPAVRRFGTLRATGVFVRALIVDGFCVASLWRRSKIRWLMHGLILYGFCGLILADVLMQIYNPTRGDLPLLSPLKLLPILSGVSVLSGVMFVMHRYRTDPYIDNGLTLGRDFLFVNLLFHTVLSGFLTVWINHTSAMGWVMPLYLYHLAAISLLIATAPFTRFAHAWVVPALVAMTRVTEAVTTSGVDLGFEREPCPGRHHKSERIAHDVLSQVDPAYTGDLKMRYYP